MQILEQRHGAVTVVCPHGPLIAGDADTLKARLDEVVSRTTGRFVLDASAVSFIDSRGLEALLDVTEQLLRGGQAMKICAANEVVREVLELTDLATLFEQYEDVHSAVRSFL